MDKVRYFSFAMENARTMKLKCRATQMKSICKIWISTSKKGKKMLSQCYMTFNKTDTCRTCFLQHAPSTCNVSFWTEGEQGKKAIKLNTSWVYECSKLHIILSNWNLELDQENKHIWSMFIMIIEMMKTEFLWDFFIFANFSSNC